MSTQKFDEIINGNYPDYVKDTMALLNWSTNCEYPTPYNFFLDLIGWSQDQYGENLCQSVPDLGYLELDYLADALKEFTARPKDVRDWITDLHDEEMKDDEDDDN